MIGQSGRSSPWQQCTGRSSAAFMACSSCSLRLELHEVRPRQRLDLAARAPARMKRNVPISLAVYARYFSSLLEALGVVQGKKSLRERQAGLPRVAHRLSGGNAPVRAAGQRSTVLQSET